MQLPKKISWENPRMPTNKSPFPLIEAHGNHRQIGQQIGEQLRQTIQNGLEDQRAQVPSDETWQEMIHQSALYLAHSQSHFPQYVEELRGIAEGAAVPFESLFLSICEEIWDTASRQGRLKPRLRGCTDMVARASATQNGLTLIAHTNDLLPESEAHLVLLNIRAEHEPEILAVSPGGVAISVGFNAAGISLTGNQVDSNDMRPGVPRLLLVRAILASKRLGEAMDICLHPHRASNYNNVVADAYGEVYSMEGSATDCEPIYIEGDLLAHTNHYISPPMRGFEIERHEIGGSVVRYHRAMRLMRDHYGTLSPQVFMKLLADHQNYPASICKHGLETVTVFSIVIDLEDFHAWIGRGRPCQTEYHEYFLSPDEQYFKVAA